MNHEKLLDRAAKKTRFNIKEENVNAKTKEFIKMGQRIEHSVDNQEKKKRKSRRTFL